MTATPNNIPADFSAILDADPAPEKIKQNEDGSFYIPISIVQNDLDLLFGHSWNWDFEHEVIGKSGAMGKGKVWVVHPITGQTIMRSGTAAINFTGQMRLDYPRLEAMTFLNAVKKIGRCFGRDLNRNIDDAPTPITKSDSNPEIDQEFENTKKKLLLITDRNTAEKFLQSTTFKYHTELKQIVSSKK